MSQYVDQAGTFRGIITDYGVKKHEKAGAVSYALNIRVALHECYDKATEQWVDWRESDVTADGFLNIIKRDGNWNEAQAVAIVEHGGWDGTFASLPEGTWKPTQCQFDIKLDTWGDSDTFKVDWLAAYDRVPGGLGNCDAKTAKALDAKMGSSLRAITGNVKRAAAQPKGAPPAPAATPAPAPAAEAPPTRKDDDIPF